MRGFRKKYKSAVSYFGFRHIPVILLIIGIYRIFGVDKSASIRYHNHKCGAKEE